jgi:bifunctional non-homologous end joining protein LigD
MAKNEPTYGSCCVPPCEPTQRDRPPKAMPGCTRFKFDAYRMQIHKAGRQVTIFTRNGHDWTDRFPRLAAQLAVLSTCIIDAELVVTDENGKLQRTVSRRQEDGLAPWAFDLLNAGGKDLRGVPYIERKRRLTGLVASAGVDRLRHSECFSDGDRLLAECGKRGLEGIVSKRRDSAYRAGKQTS